jgi:predicted metal-dependent enzyme (double-stranded beta helix superfamily)
MTDIFETEFRKAPHYTRHESAAGVRISPGHYVGIVKNNNDPTRSGKLQVYIEELGGDANGLTNIVGPRGQGISEDGG